MDDSFYDSDIKEIKDEEIFNSIINNLQSKPYKSNKLNFENIKLKNNITNISYDNINIKEIMKLVPPENKIYLEIYLNIYTNETLDLIQLPNLFVLYNPTEQTITYNGSTFYRYEETKSSKENNYTLFCCKSYRHYKYKLKGKTKYCYTTIRFYYNENPELISFYMQQYMI